MKETASLVDACAQAEANMQTYLDEMLCGEVRLAIDAHLTACPHCARAYAFERKLRAHVRSCCGGSMNEEHCREELRQRLERCCHNTAD